MDLARYVVDAVVLEGRSYRDVAQAHGVSKSWVAKLVGRFRAGGYPGIVPRSRAPKRIPHRTPPEIEDEIVRLRKNLSDQGFDAGAETIHHHLSTHVDRAPSWANQFERGPGKGIAKPASPGPRACVYGSMLNLSTLCADTM